MGRSIGGNKGRRRSSTVPQARPAREAPNTLRSKSTARVVDLLSEGPIEGLVNGYQSIFFDDTALFAANGRANFEGVSVETRDGDPVQEPLVGFPYVEKEVEVGVQVTTDSPVTRTIISGNVDAVRVKIRVPQLLSQNLTTGDLNPTTVKFDIFVKPNGGVFEKADASYAWKNMTGSQTVGLDAKALRVTVKKSITGIVGQTLSTSLTAQYRAVGSVTWLTLGTRTITQQLTKQNASFNIGSVSVTQNIYNSTTNTIIQQLSCIFELTGLSADQYEFRVTDGTLVKAEEYSASPIVISGKCTSPYEESYRIPLPEDGAPWDIKVVRVTADSATANVQDAIYWGTYTEVTDVKPYYPDSALTGLTVDAESFGNVVPVRSYEIKGLQVQVPSNYNPITREYTGIWDGTFQVAWTNNPAWVLYDILTNNRYGLGNSIAASQVDKFAFYDIAQYCDELVPDGYGGTEPRFTFNGVLNTRKEAFEVVQLITSAFRGMAYWGSGMVTAVQDAPADPVKLVTNSNVIDGLFTYSGSSLKSRHSVALVTWNDPANGYRPTIEIVEDPDYIQQYGWNQVDTVAIGCTSRGQARRFGRWILDSEKNQTEHVVYKASFDHGFVRPGDIILLQDEDYAEVRFGGRLSGATLTSVTIDEAIDLESGETYTVSMHMPDGTVEDRPLTNIVPTSGVTVLTWTEDLPDTPIDGALWVITASNVEPRQFRVVAVKELQKNIWEIQALIHDVNKYARVEENLKVEAPQFTIIKAGPLELPSNLTVREYKYTTASGMKSAVLFSWSPSKDPRVNFYEVNYQRPGDTEWQQAGTTGSLSITIQDTIQGVWNLRVRPLDGMGGLVGEYVEKAFELDGMLVRPANVEGFNLNVVRESAYLTWDIPSDLEVDHYVIKFSPAITGATWGSSTLLTDNIPKMLNTFPVQAQIGTYLIKAVSAGGIESATAGSVVTTIGNITNLNAILTITKDPLFMGEYDGVGLI